MYVACADTTCIIISSSFKQSETSSCPTVIICRHLSTSFSHVTEVAANQHRPAAMRLIRKLLKY